MDQEQHEFQNVDNTLQKSVISTYAFSRKYHMKHILTNGGLSSDSLKVLFHDALS